MNNTYWSLGVLVGLPIAGIFTIAAITAIVIGARLPKRTDDPYATIERPRRFTLACAIPSLIVILGIAGLAMWPWSAEYHQWRPVSGSIAEVQSRLLSAGDNGGSNQKFVVRFTGNRQEYSCEDTRCALLKPGQHLELTCIRAWQYAGTPGYSCAYFRSDGDQ